MSPDRAPWLSHDAYLQAFAADTQRLSALARDVPADTPVPTCPGWDVLDLVRHVGDVYAHKLALVRLGRRPQEGEWPLGDGLALEAALDRHDTASAELASSLAQLGPDASCWTWMQGVGEGTSGAWARRMAHEALVHRVDAEAAAGAPVRAAAPGLAADGIVEVLTWMAGDPDVVADPGAQAGAAGSVRLDWGPGAVVVDLPDAGHTVRPPRPDEEPDAALRGDALSLDLYLWGRLDALPRALLGDLDVVEASGPVRVLERLSARLALATQ